MARPDDERVTVAGRKSVVHAEQKRLCYTGQPTAAADADAIARPCASVAVAPPRRQRTKPSRRHFFNSAEIIDW